MTADQIFFGLGLTVVLAVGSQILASRVRIPALIVLLPVGFIAAASSARSSSAPSSPAGYQFGQFLLSVGVGLAGGIVGTALLWLVLRELDMGGVLGSLATVASVIGVAAGCDIARDDTGLLAALVMGLALANLPGFDIPARRPFGETVIQLLIGVLFISISASVTPSSVRSVLLPTLGLVAVLVLVTRPLVAWVSTLRSNLSKGERAFIGWMAPRGIVAAATASAFSKTLIARGIGGAADILPTTF